MSQPQIPEPIIPAPLEAAPKAKAKTATVPPFTVVSSQHIIDTLAKSSAGNRLTRLTTLARTNRDVAWLLSEYKTKPSKKNKTESN